MSHTSIQTSNTPPPQKANADDIHPIPSHLGPSEITSRQEPFPSPGYQDNLTCTLPSSHPHLTPPLPSLSLVSLGISCGTDGRTDGRRDVLIADRSPWMGRGKAREAKVRV